MAGFFALLRSGEWLTRERIRLVAGAVLVASLAGLGYLLATSNGPNDYQGRPLGTDFSNVYAAGTSVDPIWLLLAAAYPAVFVNLGHGHNGFLTAALLGGALVLLDRRPIVAGVLFGLMAYKPQFGLMIPLVLIATGRWRAFAAA